MKTIKTNKRVKEAVLGYFSALVTADGEAAMGFCAKSWQGEADARWMRLYGRMFNDLVDFSVVAVSYKNDNFAQVTVLTDNGVEEREYLINVLRESAPYVLSHDGTWGCVPSSMRML